MPVSSTMRGDQSRVRQSIRKLSEPSVTSCATAPVRFRLIQSFGMRRCAARSTACGSCSMSQASLKAGQAGAGAFAVSDSASGAAPEAAKASTCGSVRLSFQSGAVSRVRRPAPSTSTAPCICPQVHSAATRRSAPGRSASTARMLWSVPVPPVGRALLGPAVARDDLVVLAVRDGVDAALSVHQRRPATAGADVDGEKEVARHRRASVSGSKKCACVMSSVTVVGRADGRGIARVDLRGDPLTLGGPEEQRVGAQRLDGFGREGEAGLVDGMAHVLGADAEDDGGAVADAPGFLGGKRQALGAEHHGAALDPHVEEVHRRAADEVRDEAVGGPFVERDRVGRLFDVARPHDDDAVGHRHRLDLVVGDVDGGRAEPALEKLDLGAHLDAELGVEVRQRLVEQEDLRMPDERAADGDALPLAAREVARLAVEIGVEGEKPGGFVHARRDLGLRRAVDLHRVADVLRTVMCG
jgi:hypothetical protein